MTSEDGKERDSLSMSHIEGQNKNVGGNEIESVDENVSGKDETGGTSVASKEIRGTVRMPHQMSQRKRHADGCRFSKEKRAGMDGV